jgi:hypothetical protein
MTVLAKDYVINMFLYGNVTCLTGTSKNVLMSQHRDKCWYINLFPISFSLFDYISYFRRSGLSREKSVCYITHHLRTWTLTLDMSLNEFRRVYGPKSPQLRPEMIKDKNINELELVSSTVGYSCPIAT